MRRTRIRPISDKRRDLLRREDEIERVMLEQCEGHCMRCGNQAILEKSHNRRRDAFELWCHECHFPGGEHCYLGGVGIQEVSRNCKIVKRLGNL